MMLKSEAVLCEPLNEPCIVELFYDELTRWYRTPVNTFTGD